MKIQKIKLVTFAESWRKWEEKNRRRGEIKNGGMKKWTEGAVAGIYKAVLPTNSSTELKKIILIYSVGEASKIHR
jgi:hypothetical protein